MNLTLKSFQRVKQDAVELIAAFDNIGASEEHLEYLDQIKDVSSTIDKAIENVLTIEMYSDSLKQCGYSDKWFDSVNFDHKFKEIVDLDIPRFTKEHFRRGEICTESFWDSIKRWVAAAWEMIKKFFAWCAEQLHQLVVFLGIDQGNLSRFEEQALKWADQYFDSKLGARGINCNELIDLTLFGKHVKNILVLEAIMYGPGTFSLEFIKEDIGNILEDRAHRAEMQTAVGEMFCKKLKRHLDNARIDYEDINKSGLGFEGTTLKIYNGAYPKSNLTITNKEDVKKVFDQCISLKNDNGQGAFDIIKDMAHRIETTIKPHRDHLSKIVNGLAAPRPNEQNDPEFGFQYVNPVANVCQYNLMLTITSKIIAFCAKYKNTVMSNAKTLANLIRVANGEKTVA